MMVWDGSAGGRVSVTAPSREDLLEDLRRRLSRREGFTVATLNLDHVTKLRSNTAFREAYCAHSHVTADGNPIVWMSRLAGQRIELAPGSELIGPIAKLAAEAGAPIGLLGATEPALEAAAEALMARYPGLEIVMTLAPEMGFDPVGASADRAMEAIRASGARLVFLALGAPKQEIFAARANAALGDVGFLSIGAGLDFIAGTQKRAPGWVRAIAAEWLWRMMGDPRRLTGRYLACLGILPALAVQALGVRWRGQSCQ